MPKASALSPLDREAGMSSGIFPRPNFERPEVFDPLPFGRVRFRLAPELELIEILDRNLPIA